MAGAGAKLFTDGSVLNAAQVNTYLMDQTIMRFATTAARDAAFGGAGEPTLAEGMTCYIDADNSIYTYDGSAWVKMVSASTPPALTLISSGSFTNATSASAVNLAGMFTTEFPHYRIMMSWTQSTAAGYLNIQLRSAAGIVSTATYDNQRVDNYSTTVLAGGSLGNNAWITLAYNYNLGFSSYFNADIMYASVAQNTYLLGRGGTKRTGAGGVYMYCIDSHGMQTDSTVMTGMVLYPDSGAMTGTYSLYGYR